MTIKFHEKSDEFQLKTIKISKSSVESQVGKDRERLARGLPDGRMDDQCRNSAKPARWSVIRCWVGDEPSKMVLELWNMANEPRNVL